MANTRLILLILASLLVSTLIGRGREPSPLPKGLDIKLLLAASKVFQKTNPEITSETINKDIEVIKSTISSVVPKLLPKEVTKDDEIVTTIIMNWQQIRVGRNALKATDRLSEKRWLTSFNDLETCKIQSTPVQGASVIIEGITHTSTTNMFVGLQSNNTYKVRLKKGTTSAEGELKVEKGGKNTFTGELK